MMTASSSQQSSLCRISEDTKLRPFLSPLFDAQAYIKTVIKEGKSEECFFNIVGCIDEINVEIKGYISQHKVCSCALFLGSSTKDLIKRNDNNNVLSG